MPRIEPIPWDEIHPRHREELEAAIAAGAFTQKLPLQVLAYAYHEKVPDDGDRHPNHPRHLLSGKIIELVRIRSAQLGGCEPCSASRKVEGATEEVVACLINPALRGDLTERERLAIEFLERLSADHHGIDDEFYRRLGQNYTTAEIIELGTVCGTSLGMHRFMHTLNVYGDTDPVISYDPAQMGATWADLHPEAQPAKQGEAA